MTNEDIKKFRRRAMKKNSKRKIRDYGVEILSAVIVGVLVTIVVSVFSSNLPFFEEQEDLVVLASPAILAESTAPTHRSAYIRAMLAQVLSHTSLAKMQIDQYYMSTGKLPKNIQDIGMSALDYQEFEVIDDFYITSKGGIRVALSSDFGNQKALVLQPKVSSSGAMIHWRCETNVEKEHLGIKTMPLCNYKADL